jgi:hypothetical protein
MNTVLSVFWGAKTLYFYWEFGVLGGKRSPYPGGRRAPTGRYWREVECALRKELPLGNEKGEINL